MKRETRRLLILIAIALILVALGQIVYRSGVLTDSETRLPGGDAGLVE
jgi:hypothetical protein